MGCCLDTPNNTNKRPYNYYDNHQTDKNGNNRIVGNNVNNGGKAKKNNYNGLTNYTYGTNGNNLIQPNRRNDYQKDMHHYGSDHG